MMQVFIVDDEYYIREGLKHIVPWEKLGFTVIGDAECAEDAMEKLSENTIDILLADIQMSSINGLELTEWVKDNKPGVEIIIITGHDEFRYVQEAIKKDVVDYILKPIDEDELVQALERARDRIQRRNSEHKNWSKKIIKAMQNNDLGELDYVLSVMKKQISNETWKQYGLVLVDDVVEAILGDLNESSAEHVRETVCKMEFEQMEFSFCKLESMLKDLLHAKNSTGKIAIVESVKQYVEEHYDEKITLHCLARKMFINTSYLSNLFSEVAGVNYRDYVTSVRVRHAKKLLKTTDYSIEEISRRTGFSDSKYFSKIFKKSTGETPRSYRKG